MEMMPNGPQIAFVWPPEKISDHVIRAAQRTSTRIVCDLTNTPRSARRLGFFGPRNVSRDVLQVLVLPDEVMGASFEKFIVRSGTAGVWIDTNPALVGADADRLIQRLGSLAGRCACGLVVGDARLLVRFLENGDKIPHICLKGCEAAGFVGTESTLTLFTLARKHLSQQSSRTSLHIWGGIATPDAAAAFLDGGADGIVFESLHWLTDAFCPNSAWRKKVARLGIASTELVGTETDIPARFFNKGNSLAVREVKADLTSAGKEFSPERRRDLIVRIRRHAVPPLQAEFSRHELVSLGTEAAFAGAFAERFGRDLETAIHRFKGEIEDSLARAADRKREFLAGGPVRDFGIRYPFVQGAMTWISDSIAFSHSVSDAGGLPTLALGLMDRATLDRKLGCVRTELGSRPYAVNFLALPENLFLTEQLAWIREHRPPIAVIAAGDPAVGTEIRDYVRELVYIAPDIDLLQKAVRAGIRYIVCEGNEAGGHVGRHTILTLAQAVLELKRRDTDLLSDCRIILAGGFFDASTVSIAALLGADAIQMGTAYLCTEEIVVTNALQRLYQETILTASPGDTVVTGRSVGLPVRSLRNEKAAALFALERECRAGQSDEAALRRKFESLASGSLHIAAKGVDCEGTQRSREECLAQGQFMCGTVSGFLDRVRSLEELHAGIAAGLVVPADALPQTPRCRRQRRSSKHAPPPCREGGNGSEKKIAITGISLVNSLGNTPEEVWSACMNGQSGVTFVPPVRWSHDLYYDPRPYTPDKTYCRVAGFKSLAITRQDVATSPQDFATMSGATRLTLYLAGQVIRQSGITAAGIPPERIGVFVAQNSGERAGTLEDIIVRACAEKLTDAVQRAVPLTSQQVPAVVRQLKASRKTIDDTTLVGRLNSTAAGFICNRYNFLGPSFSVSAACASSLAALFCAVQMIRQDIIDAAVVGGGEENLGPLDFMEFSALGVLAGFSGVQRAPEAYCRPFDRDRDGMVLGEGGAMIVIEKASTARARGAPVHGYIVGIGASNNPHGLVEPAAGSQKLAMQSAFREAAAFGFDRVDLVECHATATRMGDAEELRALSEAYGGNGRTFLTSLKSQTGHTLGAAGLSSLIRGILAMKNGVLPPTINYENPDPILTSVGTGLTVLADAADWPCRNGRPRRLQVNAFGFGGSNYVALIEEGRSVSGAAVCRAAPQGAPQTEVKTVDAHPPTLPGLFLFRRSRAGNACRIGLTAHSQADALRRAREFEPCCSQASVASAGKTFLQKASKILYAGCGTSTLAFVFPGQGSQYPAMATELCAEAPEIHQTLTRLAAGLDFDLMDFLFAADNKQQQVTCHLQPALFCLEVALFTFLARRGILPDAAAGHSLGEFAALCAAGVFSPEDGLRLVTCRARCMQQAADRSADGSIMLAVNASLSRVREIIGSQKNVCITNINAPEQIVVGGSTDAVEALRRRLSQQHIRHTRVKVAMAFHSPIMRTIRDEFSNFAALIPFSSPRFPVVSAATGKLLPNDPDRIREILVSQLESPVLWCDTVQTLRQTCNIRTFLEIGPGDVLSRLIEAADHAAICTPTCLENRESRTLKAALACLFAGGRYDPPDAVCEIDGIPDAIGAEAPSLAGNVDRDPSLTDDVIRQEIAALLSRPVAEMLRACLLERIRAKYGPAFSENRLDRFLASEAGIAARELLFKPAQVLPSTSFRPCEGPKDFHDPATVLETVIDIIVDATGYERDEIGPDMDLREDLSIRSTRLPVILDAMETVFGYPFTLEEFIGVRTVRDIALRAGARFATPRSTYEKASPQSVELSGHLTALTSQSSPETRRLVMGEQPLQAESMHPLQIDPTDRTVVFSETPQSRQSFDGVQSALQDLYPVSYRIFPFPLPDSPGENAMGDMVLKDASGMVFLLSSETSLNDAQRSTERLQGFFCLLQSFLRSPVKKFVLLICRATQPAGLSDVFAHGVAGMFLSAAQEFKDTLFRVVYADEQTDPARIIACALNTTLPEIEQVWRKNALHTRVWMPCPKDFRPIPAIESLRGPVVLVSGGARGITFHLARALSSLEPRLVLIGRTPLTPVTGDSGGSLNPVRQAIADLQAAGVYAEYRSCDVCDPEALQVVVDEVVKRHGRIDGILHGAGVLRDRLIADMTKQDFSEPLQVKLQGAWNLFNAAKCFGLKFFIALSSVVGVHGNLGQANYACANRALAALLHTWDRQHPHIRGLTLMLPPIDGAGMAVEPETRELMRRKGWGPDTFLHVDELANLFRQELLVPARAGTTVLLAKSLPERATSRILLEDPLQTTDRLCTPVMAFPKKDFPLIDAVDKFDPRASVIEVSRAFAAEKDLWLSDHKPFKFIRHPLVAAIMAIESFMEATELLFPYLRVHRVENAVFEEMIECPPDLERATSILCRCSQTWGKEIRCRASLAVHDISPKRRKLGRLRRNFKADLILSGPGHQVRLVDTGFPIMAEELDGPSKDTAEMMQWYREATDFKGRYLLLRSLDGYGPGLISGKAVYPSEADFEGYASSPYRYAPYALEAALHLVAAYHAETDAAREGFLIPLGIRELVFQGSAAAGDEIKIEARLIEEDTDGTSWDARCLKADGTPILHARGIRMRRIHE